MTLSRTERLKSRKAIEQLFNSGKRFSQPPFKILYQKSEQTGLLFGTGVSTKNFKKAVDRNKVKRLMREAYRLQKHTLQQVLIEKQSGLDLFFIYTGKEIPAYQYVVEKIGESLQQLIELIEK